MRHAHTVAATVLLTSLLTGCERPRAWGDRNAIIVATSEEQWAAVGERVESALEATIVTVRSEKTFRVTHQVPTGEGWRNLQRFSQLLLIGAAGLSMDGRCTGARRP